MLIFWPFKVIKADGLTSMRRLLLSVNITLGCQMPVLVFCCTNIAMASNSTF